MKLIEHYLSLQGEGLRSGQLTYFVRFARCNLRCTWCDSAYTFGAGKEVAFKTIAQAIQKSKVRYVCLTGGEPLLHSKDCLNLIQHFPHLHFDIETGGALDISKMQLGNTSVIMDWKLSKSGMHSKMRQANLTLLRPQLDLLKLVSDGSAIEKKEMKKVIAATKPLQLPISIQPVFGSDPQPLAEWLLRLKNPRLQLNLQLHKQIWKNTQRKI